MSNNKSHLKFLWLPTSNSQCLVVQVHGEIKSDSFNNSRPYFVVVTFPYKLIDIEYTASSFKLFLYNLEDSPNLEKFTSNYKNISSWTPNVASWGWRNMYFLGSSIRIPKEPTPNMVGLIVGAKLTLALKPKRKMPPPLPFRTSKQSWCKSNPSNYKMYSILPLWKLGGCLHHRPWSHPKAF